MKKLLRKFSKKSTNSLEIHTFNKKSNNSILMVKKCSNTHTHHSLHEKKWPASKTRKRHSFYKVKREITTTFVDGARGTRSDETKKQKKIIESPDRSEAMERTMRPRPAKTDFSTGSRTKHADDESFSAKTRSTETVPKKTFSRSL